jgi:hypothetical protein
MTFWQSHGPEIAWLLAGLALITVWTIIRHWRDR